MTTIETTTEDVYWVATNGVDCLHCGITEVGLETSTGQPTVYSGNLAYILNILNTSYLAMLPTIVTEEGVCCVCCADVCIANCEHAGTFGVIDGEAVFIPYATED